MTITEEEKSIIEEFSIYEDWMDKYAYLIELGNELPDIDDKHKISENLIRGCQSRVWLTADYHDGKIFFEGDSDAIIVKGLVALMLRVLSGHTPQEIIDTDLSFIDEIGLKQHLSPTRSNGLMAMVKQMKLYAVAYRKLAEEGRIS
ncbi:MAG: SufE family protein [Bacteroidota bacterium]|nr:SufE family protein [Bacteroidota bacterium]MDP4205197.1 SufE family protein [Bacteroidota bacterium]